MTRKAIAHEPVIGKKVLSEQSSPVLGKQGSPVPGKQYSANETMTSS